MTGEHISIIIGILGIAGLLFTALKYNRDDTTSILNQQAELYNELKELNIEMRQSRDDCLELVKKYESKL